MMAQRDRRPIRSERPRLLRCLFRHIAPHRKKQLRWTFVLMLLGAAAELLTLGTILPFLAMMANPKAAGDLPLLGLPMADLAALGHDPWLLVSIGFVAAAVLAGLLRLVLAWVSAHIAFALAHDIGTQVFHRALCQTYADHLRRDTGLLLADMEKVQLVALNVLMPAMTAASALVISSCILVALLWIEPFAALGTVFGFAGLYIVVSRRLRRRFHRNSRAIAGLQIARFRLLQEAGGAIRDILLDAAQHRYRDRFAEIDRPSRHRQADNAFLAAAPRYLFEAFGMMLIALLALVLTARPGGMAVALPILGAVALASVRLLPLMQQIYNAWSQIAGNRQSLQDVLAALDLPLPKTAPAPPPLDFQDAIRLQGLSFRYGPTLPLILSGLSLTIPRGARLGVVGKTGAGKSTLMDLLLGLLVPSVGQILVDDVPLHPGNHAAWQARIAHLPQSLYLADASIAENIAFGLAPQHIDLERVQRAAEQAALSEVIAALPEGLATQLGPGGTRLSGGQRQRLGIARALYRNADVLVLDEPTSALDAATEAEVMAAIRGLSPDVTLILIAHQRNLLAACDLILQLPEGRLMPQTPAPVPMPQGVG